MTESTIAADGVKEVQPQPGWASFAQRTVEFVATAAVLVLMGHTLLNVFMRYVLNSPVRGTNELVANWYLPLIAFTGFIIAQVLNRHISATLIFDRLPTKNRREVAIFGALLGTVLCGLFAYFTSLEAIHSMEINRRVVGTTAIIIWPATFAAPIAYATLCALFGLNAWRYFQGQPVAESEDEFHLEHATAEDKSTSAQRWIIRGAIALLIGGSMAAMFYVDSRQVTAIFAIILMLTLLFLRVPVAFALAGPGLLGLYAVRPRSVYTMLEAEPYEAVASWSFSVLPMFIFMGLLLWKSGLTTRIYVAARHWLSWMPGGLAVSTNAAGTGLAAVSGSTLGTTYALSRIGIPEMLKAGYDRRLAVGSVMVAGLPGQLIPPSTFLIIYAGIAEVPVGPQLMAGIGPGLLVAAVFSVAMIAFSFAMPSVVGRTRGKQTGEIEKSSWNDRWQSLAAVWPLPVLIMIVLGGMYSGVLTATEAGSAGALGALMVALFLQRGNAGKAILEAGIETVIATGTIFLLIIGAEILSSLLTLSGLADGFATWIGTAGFDRVQFLLIVMVAYLILGMFMDPLPILLLTVPLLIPILLDMEISLLWFGVFAVFMGELGILTPPVGILSFIVHNLVQDKAINRGQEISLGDVFTAVAWFMPIAIVAAFLLILFPEVATWLPDSMM